MNLYFKVVQDIQLSKNFKLSEFVCKEGKHEVLYDPLLIRLLQNIRDELGKPIIINSGYRSIEYNRKVGGSPKSQHLYGKAVDVKVSGVSSKSIALITEMIADVMGIEIGIGIYDTFVHIDTRGYKARWNG